MSGGIIQPEATAGRDDFHVGSIGIEDRGDVEVVPGGLIARASAFNQSP
jgi:hypothetical protein